MGTPTDDVRLLAGNLALDYLNTQGGEPEPGTEHDILRTYVDVVAWGRQARTLDDTDAARLVRAARRHPDRAAAAYARAGTFRRALKRVFEAIIAGRIVPGTSLSVVRDEAADALGHGELVARAGTFRWAWGADSDLMRPLWPVAHAAVGLLTTGPLDRVKRCAGCRWWFLDETRNGSRRWCSMDDCGTAEKMRRYVAKRAEARKLARATDEEHVGP